MKAIGWLLLGLIIGGSLSFGWFQYKGVSQAYELRAAMDIGSGTTNMKIAKVDKETDKVISIIFEKTVAVPYSKHLELSKDQKFDDEVTNQSIQTMKEFKKIALDHQAKRVVAVATAAFRKAQNGSDLATKIRKESGVQVNIIDQKTEGELAYLAAIAKAAVDPQDAVVWDIGGGSFQFTMHEPPNKYRVYEGDIASIAFKNTIIENIQHKDPQTVHSPNPMSISDMDQAIGYAESVAEKVDPVIKDKIKHHTTRVLAAGNLFNKGLKKLMGGETVIVREHLEEKLKSMAGKTDAEINEGSLSEVTISNGLFVVGVMKALDIEQITVVDVNNADGLLIDLNFW